MVEDKRGKPLSTAIKLFWGIGNGVMVLSTTMGSYYQTYWETDIAKFTPATIGLVSTISTILGLVLSPLIGAWLDMSKPINKKWGKYRSWLVYGSLIGLVTAGLNWIRWSENEAVAAGVRIAILLIATFPGTCRTQSDNALLTVVARTPADKNILASRKYMFSNVARLVSNIIVTSVCAFLLARGLSEGTAYVILAYFFAFLTFFGFLAQFKLTEGYEGEGIDEIEVKKKAKVTFKDVIMNLFTNDQLLFLFIANSSTSCVAYILTKCAAYYWRAIVGEPGMMGTYSLVVNGLGILGTLAVGEATKKFDNKKLSMFALLMMAVTIFFVRPLGLKSKWLFIGILAAHQFFASFNYPIFVAGYANCTVYAEYKNGKSSPATIMGISGYPLRIAGTVTAWIVPMALAKAGYVAGQPATEAVAKGILNIYSVWGPAFCGVALVIIALLFKLDNKRLAEIQTAIEERRAAESAE